MIKKISDLILGAFFEKDLSLSRQVIVKALINEQEKFISDKTEILLETTYPRKKLAPTYSIVSEIGIEETKEEALNNYGIQLT